MTSNYIVNGVATPEVLTGAVRTYYIAAEETIWNYGPVNKPDNVWLTKTATTIGSVYRKARYFQYTDDKFTTKVPIPADQLHLGILGPTIRAEVGDTIVIHFMNKLTTVDHNLTMHSHGVIYDRASEGAGIPQGIPPGQNITYVWRVPTRSGPGPNDPSSVMWAYHSHVDNPVEFASGLVGGIIITKKGSAKSPGDPRPSDVDRELFVMYAIFDENLSLFLDYNVQTNAPAAQVDDPDFIESNLKHGINGYIFNNLAGLDMYPAERVRWYVVGFGDESDVHTPHWHGHTVLDYGRRVDTVSLIPAQFKVVDMVPDNIGTWEFHCHVNGHHTDGMFTDYRVLCKTNCPIPPPPTQPINAATSTVVSFVLMAMVVLMF
jgi:hypothetical protein